MDAGGLHVDFPKARDLSNNLIIEGRTNRSLQHFKTLSGYEIEGETKKMVTSINTTSVDISTDHCER